jgi:hypothetical protein
MKNLTFLLGLFLLIVLGVSSSCKNDNQKIGDYRNDLSAESKTAITKEIMDLTDNCATNLCKMDFDKAIEMYDSSSEFMYAENGAFFLNRDSLYNYMKSIKSSAESFHFQWKQRFVIPLSLNAASLAGSFSFKIGLKTGDIFEGTPMFVGTFVRKNDKWVLIHGNESSKIKSEDK